MATVNRYTNITPSAYSPMSLNEILMVPQMKRMQHNQADESLINLESQLAKVDPLDVHLNEANRLRSDINSRIQTQAEQLASQGFNTNTLSGIKRTNRELTELMSPTGRIGQINAAKQVYSKNMNNYLEDATKNKGWSRERALHNWYQNVHQPYTGFDETGNITNVDQYGAPKKIDTLEKLKSVKDLLGEQVVNEIASSGYRLIPQSDGSVIMADSSGRRIETSNRPNLENALNLLNQQMNDPEWRDSINFEGVDPRVVQNEIVYGINSMLNTDVSDNRGTNYGLHGYSNPNDKEKEVGIPGVITEDVDIQDQNSDVNAFKTWITPNEQRVTGRGESLSISKEGTGLEYENKPVNRDNPAEMKQRFEEIFNPEQQRRYMETYNAKVAQGKIPKNTSPYSVKAQNAVKSDWERQKNINYSNKIIIPDSEQNDILASPQLVGKDVKQRDEFIQRRFNVALGNKQNILYDKEGKPVDMEDVDSSTLTLNGHYAPINKLPKFGGSTSNAISPHNVSWKDSDGELHTGLMVRDASEMNNPRFRAAKVIKTTTDKAVNNEGNFTTFDIKSLPELSRAGLSGMRVKYDNNNQTYTIEAFKDGKLLEKSQPMNSEQYQNAMYNLIP